MINLSYKKPKSVELFRDFSDPHKLFLSNIQNYHPLLERFFQLNETNYDHIQWNHPCTLCSVGDMEAECDVIYTCEIINEKLKLKTRNPSKYKKHKLTFFKLAPLLDPLHYLTGKYDVNGENDERIWRLPKWGDKEGDGLPKMADPNHFAYIDAFFLFLSSNLPSSFVHSVEYYGTYSAIKHQFKFNIYHDLDYLNGSEYFLKYKNERFQVEDYDHLIYDGEDYGRDLPTKQPPLKIGDCVSLKSVCSVDDHIFEGIFHDADASDSNPSANANNEANVCLEIETIDPWTLDIHNANNPVPNATHHTLLSKTMSIRTPSTCSSRTSHTTMEEFPEMDLETKLDHDYNNTHNEDVDVNENMETSTYDEDEATSTVEDDTETTTKTDVNTDINTETDEGSNEDESEDNDEDEEIVEVTIPRYPVQVIAMECCESTLDDLIITEELSTEEWFSILMQIIMILITYQKVFQFTHNDLHTNNIMYISTHIKYLYYRFNGEYYRVPTFGRIFKIIDFGRSIYRFRGKIMCSDSFSATGDATTQYNTEPYFNDKKPRIDPNPSFDLCRLACSIFDCLVDDLREVRHLDSITDPVKKLIVEWCLDDNGINMLYKYNGEERYAGFKIYKMIARCVHHHTPQAQLMRPEFKAFLHKMTPDELKHKQQVIMDIDEMPVQIA